MTKLLISAATAALLAGAANPALAAGVLSVDLDRVMSESAPAKNATTQLQAKYQAQLTARQSALQTAAQAYQAQRSAAVTAQNALKPGTQLPQTTIQGVQTAGEKAQAAQDSYQQLGQEVQNVQAYVRQQIIEHVTPLAEQVRNERKADAVVPRGSLLAVDPAGDVTALVIQRLNTSFPNPSITLPQQPAGQGR